MRSKTEAALVGLNRCLLAVLVFGMLVISSRNGWAATEIPANWVVVESEHFRVAVSDRHRRDAGPILEYAEQARDRMAAYLGEEPVSCVTIFLYDRATFPSSPSSAWAEPRSREIHLLAPSAQTQEDRRWADARWYEKNIFHEYVHIALEPLAGSRFQRQLFWLNEGLPEYLSVYQSTPAIRARYRHYDQEIRDLMRNGETAFLHLPWTYGTAAIFVRYLEEEYGEGTALALWRASSGLMSGAVVSILGVTPTELEERWIKWLDETY